MNLQMTWLPNKIIEYMTRIVQAIDEYCRNYIYFSLSRPHDVVKAAGSRDTDGSQEGQEGFDMYFRWHCHIGIIMGITSFLN